MVRSRPLVRMCRLEETNVGSSKPTGRLGYGSKDMLTYLPSHTKLPSLITPYLCFLLPPRKASMAQSDLSDLSADNSSGVAQRPLLWSCTIVVHYSLGSVGWAWDCTKPPPAPDQRRLLQACFIAYLQQSILSLGQCGPRCHSGTYFQIILSLFSCSQTSTTLGTLEVIPWKQSLMFKEEKINQKSYWKQPFGP